MTKDPNYVNYSRGGKIATKCRVCGGNLYTAQDIKLEAHENCLQKYTSKFRML